MSTLILKNNTALDVFISDVGIIIPASGSDTFSAADIIQKISASSVVRSLVTAATLTVNDGTCDLSIPSGLIYLTDMWVQSGFDQLPSLVTPYIATWIGTRYFAVDYDAGDDCLEGFSDVSMADAGTKAIKTLEHLKFIFPKLGNSQKAVVAIKTRAGGATYRNIADTADDNLDFLQAVYGYEHLLVRGTDTVASASSVAFANDLADKIASGARLVPGTNATGYNPVAPITANTFDVQLNGGGAPALVAEPGLIGKRIRFDSATTTVALRNATSMIWMNDTDTITLGVNLPATPVAADIFYVEEPGVAVNRVMIRTANPNDIAVPPSFTMQGVTVVGIRTVATGTAILIRGMSPLIAMAFCETPTADLVNLSATDAGDLRLLPTYTDEATTPATITVGSSLRCGGMTVSGGLNFVATSYACISFRPQVLNVTNFSFGAASYSATGALVQGCGLSTSPANSVGGVSIGNLGSATSRRYRCVGAFSGTEISVNFANALLHGIDLTLAGASSLIAVNGISCNININDVVGSTGNTGVGLSLTLARDCHILLGTVAANTFTGAAGQEIQGGGPVFYVHADYARTDLRDANGNHLQGAGLSIMGPTTLAINNAVAAIGQYKIVRATGSGVVQTAQADTAANAAGIVGVCQSPFTAAPVQNSMLVNAGATWVQFDAAPTAGNIAYLSTSTTGNAQDTVPAVAGTNRKLRLGRILRVSGTLGLVMWNPEALSVLADGGA